MNIDKILKRIKQLLAMAADQSSPHEAAIAARRAQALMSQHQVDHADIIAAELQAGEGLTSQATGRGYRKPPSWYGILGYAVGIITEVSVKYDWEGMHCRIHFQGYRPDVELAGVLLAYLTAQMEGTLKARKAEMGGKVGRRWAGDYRHGYASAVQQQAKKVQAERDAGRGTGSDLMIYKQDAIAKHFGATKVRNTRKSMSHGQGLQDGNKARIRLDVRHQHQGRYLSA